MSGHSKPWWRGVVTISLCLAISVGLVALAPRSARATPPYDGTVFLDPDIITSADRTVYSGETYIGQGMRTIYDRRVDDWVTVNCYLFNTTFTSGRPSIEVDVNPEFSSAGAETQAVKYATEIGRLPNVLRTDVQQVWINKGDYAYGGGNDSILIHTGITPSYENTWGCVDEALFHEGTHTSLDAITYGSAWTAAANADGEFISTYARDNPTSEDVSESFLAYYAVRYHPDRISKSMRNTILVTIPNRIAYFDSQNYDMFPTVPEPGTLSMLAAGVIGLFGLSLARKGRESERGRSGSVSTLRNDIGRASRHG